MKKSTQFNQNRRITASQIKFSGMFLLSLLFVSSLLFVGCSTRSPSSPTIQTTVLSSNPTTDKIVVGIIKVQGGDMLERDIIPQLCQVFSVSEQKVKDTLAAANSSLLINSRLTDFRRMEGMILPGEYEITEGGTLEENVATWIVASEQRYNKFLSSSINQNKLKPTEQLALASMVEAECLSGAHQEEVATVFLNRLADGSKLQSCVTAEYALGYQRPYLTGNDITIKSNYNTYYVSGLPIGPICTINDASLKAAMSLKMDSDIYYFYYDYILNDLFFFADYVKFKEGCTASSQRFKDKSAIDKISKINKQALYH